jgi:riboflavin kinase/FMN adenylyltransferase
MKLTPISRSKPDCCESTPVPGGVFVALGNFDGVHKGHLELLNAARRGAQLTGAHHPAVFTFYKGKAPAITTFDERLSLLEEAGIEEVFAADFADLCGQSPREFVEITLRSMGAVGVCCGFNFRFGKGAAGDGNTLRTLCASAGIACTVVDAVTLDGDAVSSTRIRQCLQRGAMEAAEGMLGHPWFLSGCVQAGRKMGSSVLSTPTLNLLMEADRQLPPFGVYFTETHVDGKVYPSVTNLGIRPTFGVSEALCETHLLGAAGDFYGAEVQVNFLHYHRPERKFDSPADLAATIAGDIEAATAYFAGRISHE